MYKHTIMRSRRSIPAALKHLVIRTLGDNEATEASLEAACKAAVEALAGTIHSELLNKEATHVNTLQAKGREFRERNYGKWRRGFDMLAVLRHTSIEAGQMFQRDFLRFRRFLHDPLLGVLMRLHVHACRVTGEIEALLISGYPDAAHARWRTLHEMAVFAIIIREHGQAAAQDFIRYGMIEAINGMEAYQLTASEMKRKPFSKRYIKWALTRRKALIEQCGEGIRSSHGWARPYVGGSRFPTLQKAARLERWANDYKWASQSIHFDYREMRSLLGMVEAQEGVLLCGPSHSGMTDPAHCAAIALVQVTAAFLTCYAEDDKCPIDHSTSAVMLTLLHKLEVDVGERFMETERRIKRGRSTPPPSRTRRRDSIGPGTPGQRKSRSRTHNR